MIFEKIKLLKCPDAYKQYIGQTGRAIIGGRLTLEFTVDGLRTSEIIKHTQKGKVHTVVTGSGSVYVLEEE